MDDRWKGATNLAEAVYNMVSRGEQDSSDFAKLVLFHGKEKLRRLYLQEKKRREAKPSVPIPP